MKMIIQYFNCFITQAARTVVIAELQNIVYNEWLPSIFGPDTLDKHGLRVQAGSTYEPNINAQIRNEFNTAAFRFGHSLVQVCFHLDVSCIFLAEIFCMFHAYGTHAAIFLISISGYLLRMATTLEARIILW